MEALQEAFLRLVSMLTKELLPTPCRPSNRKYVKPACMSSLGFSEAQNSWSMSHSSGSSKSRGGFSGSFGGEGGACSIVKLE